MRRKLFDGNGPPQFYSDLGMPEVERLARALAIKLGDDADRKVLESGYPEARQIPLWWTFQDDALKFLAMKELTANA